MPHFDVQSALDGADRLLEGLVTTVLLTLFVMSLSLVFALLVAMGRMSRFAAVRWPILAYVEVIRDTPLLLQLYYVYFVLPYLGIKFDPFPAAAMALTLNYSAYMSEVYRSGIQAIGKGQHDAANALGMTYLQKFRRIILPQAVRIVIPGLGNYFISLFKDTALCSTVSVSEVMFAARTITAVNYQYFTIYTVVFVLYFLVGFPAARLVGQLERRMKRGYSQRRRQADG